VTSSLKVAHDGCEGVEERNSDGQCLAKVEEGRNGVLWTMQNDYGFGAVDLITSDSFALD
jgi:hypothetical protein